MKLIGNGILITRNSETPLLFDGCVVVDGNLITDYGKTQDMKEKYTDSEFIDAKGSVIMPGLINTHHHIYSAFARGMILKDSKPSKDFGEILENLWWRVDKVLNLEDVKYSAYATFMDSIKNGVTTVIDHHASQNYVEKSLFTLADVAKELGLRASLCYEVSDRDGEEICNQAIQENVDFIKYANNDESDMIKGMFGIHASFTVSDKTLEKCVEAMGDLDAGFHIHTAEGIGDLHDSLNKYGKRVVERLHDAKILGKKTILVHCIHVNDSELELIKETDSLVVHNPESNMGNAVGCPPLLPIMDKGITIGLGTDGYTSDMFESLKVANILHKHHLCNPNVAWVEAPAMLFDNNRKIAERFFNKPLGVIEKGAYADIIIVDYDSLTPINENNINSHLLFGVMGRNVDSTMINGEFVMFNREIINVDEKAILAKSREVASRFWERV
ncbi:putative aminohydrolase SsnA [Mycoplasmatota bacterium zrk1]